MRQWECPQTDRHTHAQTQNDFIICPMLYAIAVGQIINSISCRTNSVVAIITVTVGIASAAVAAMFPAAGTIDCWLCLRWPDQYHLPYLFDYFRHTVVVLPSLFPSTPIDCIRVLKGEDNQTCSVLCCVRQLCTMIRTHMWTLLTFLHVS